MHSKATLGLALILHAVPAAARDPCPLPRAARTVLGILPHETNLADVQARFGRMAPYKEKDSLRQTLCYAFDMGNSREYLLVISDGFAGKGMVSMVRLTVEAPADPIIGECRLTAAPPRGARSPIGRRVAEVIRGLPEPAEEKGDEIHYSRRWERSKRTPWNEVFTLDGYCGVRIRSSDGRLTAIESAWHEST